jgi:hypothetical protein
MLRYQQRFQEKVIKNPINHLQNPYINNPSILLLVLDNLIMIQIYI